MGLWDLGGGVFWFGGVFLVGKKGHEGEGEDV